VEPSADGFSPTEDAIQELGWGIKGAIVPGSLSLNTSRDTAEIDVSIRRVAEHAGILATSAACPL